ADDGVLELLSERLPARRDHGRGPADLDHPRLPRGEHVVDHDARPAGALDVTKLLGLAHPHPAHVDGVVLGVVTERWGHHVGVPARPDGGDPAKALPPEVVELAVGEHAHARLTSWPAAAFRRPSPRTPWPDQPIGGCG